MSATEVMILDGSAREASLSRNPAAVCATPLAGAPPGALVRTAERLTRGA